MKGKTIKAVIAKKINDWVSSIDDPAVAELAKKNTIVTGGAIASMLLNEPVNDFDIYLRTKQAAEAIATYYVNKFTEETKWPLKLEVTPDRIRIVTERGHRGETAGNLEMLGSDQIDDAYEQAEAMALETEDDGKPRPIVRCSCPPTQSRSATAFRSSSASMASLTRSMRTMITSTAPTTGQAGTEL